MDLTRINLYQSKCAFCVPVCDSQNAPEVFKALEGYGMLAFEAQRWPDANQLAEAARPAINLGLPVSLALGAADPTQGHKVLEAALLCHPAHINQPFPLAGYTVGFLSRAGLSDIMVNGLVCGSGQPGQVILSTGPSSKGKTPALVSAQTAMAMLKEAGVMLVKFQLPRGAHDLDELAALTEAAASEGLAAIEPAGGISFENLGPILRTCLQAAPVAVIPHIFSAVVDRATQRTSPELVHRLLEIATEVLQ